MSRCPKCGKEIGRLKVVAKFDYAGLPLSLDSLAFICPECGNLLFTNEEEANAFLLEKELRSPLKEIWGQWPGEESIDEIQTMLDGENKEGMIPKGKCKKCGKEWFGWALLQPGSHVCECGGEIYFEREE